MSPIDRASEGTITPRFEFRAFAPNFGIAERRVRADAELEKIEETRQIYLVSASSEAAHNVKIRDGAVDVKSLVRREGELELWKPELRATFPLSAPDLREAVLNPLGISAHLPEESTWSLASLLQDVIFTTPDCVAAVVEKRRSSFRLGPNQSIRAEHTGVRVNGASIESIAVESSDPEVLAASLPPLGLDVYRNTSYVAAVKIVTGLTPRFGSGSALGIEEAWEKSAWEEK